MISAIVVDGARFVKMSLWVMALALIAKENAGTENAGGPRKP